MEEKITKVGIGLIGILLLYYLEGIDDTIEWVKIAIMGGFLSIFFFSPVYDLLFGKFTKEDIFSISIGLLYCVIYLIITEITAYELFVDFLKSLSMVAFISIFIEIVKEKVEEVAK